MAWVGVGVEKSLPNIHISLTVIHHLRVLVEFLGTHLISEPDRGGLPPKGAAFTYCCNLPAFCNVTIKNTS